MLSFSFFPVLATINLQSQQELKALSSVLLSIQVGLPKGCCGSSSLSAGVPHACTMPRVLWWGLSHPLGSCHIASWLRGKQPRVPALKFCCVDWQYPSVLCSVEKDTFWSFWLLWTLQAPALLWEIEREKKPLCPIPLKVPYLNLFGTVNISVIHRTGCLAVSKLGKERGFWVYFSFFRLMVIHSPIPVGVSSLCVSPKQTDVIGAKLYPMCKTESPS